MLINCAAIFPAFSESFGLLFVPLSPESIIISILINIFMKNFQESIDAKLSSRENLIYENGRN